VLLSPELSEAQSGRPSSCDRQGKLVLWALLRNATRRLFVAFNRIFLCLYLLANETDGLIYLTHSCLVGARLVSPSIIVGLGRAWDFVLWFFVSYSRVSSDRIQVM
jgi:hypothetical protein